MPLLVPRPAEVFLSHASRNESWAANLAEVLAVHGIPVWLSRRNLIGAQQWHDEIGAALGRCDWFVVVLTPAAVRSKWVKRELIYALQDDRYEDRIVPLLVRQCDHKRLSWTLAASQFVDFTGDFDHGCRELLRVWGVGYRGPNP